MISVKYKTPLQLDRVSTGGILIGGLHVCLGLGSLRFPISALVPLKRHSQSHALLSDIVTLLSKVHVACAYHGKECEIM